MKEDVDKCHFLVEKVTMKINSLNSFMHNVVT